MALGARILCVAMIAWVVTPADASARAPKSATPTAEPPAEAAPSVEAVAPPDVDPSTVSEADAAATGDDAHLTEATADEAPSTAERMMSIAPVQTMVSLFGRGVLVNDDAEEPPTTPVSVRLRTKRAGARVSLTFAF